MAFLSSALTLLLVRGHTPKAKRSHQWLSPAWLWSPKPTHREVRCGHCEHTWSIDGTEVKQSAVNCPNCQVSNVINGTDD